MLSYHKLFQKKPTTFSLTTLFFLVDPVDNFETFEWPKVGIGIQQLHGFGVGIPRSHDRLGE